MALLRSGPKIAGQRCSSESSGDAELAQRVGTRRWLLAMLPAALLGAEPLPQGLFSRLWAQWRGEQQAQKLGFVCAESLFLVEVLLLIGSRLVLCTHCLRKYALRSGHLVTAHLLAAEGCESLTSRTIPEQGHPNLINYAETENTVGASTGTCTEASRKQWVADEGAKSQAFFQQYTSKAGPQELRLPRAEQQTWPHYEKLSLSSSTVGAEDERKDGVASPDNDDILVSEPSSATLSTSPVSPANAVLEESVPNVPNPPKGLASEEAPVLTHPASDRTAVSDALASSEKWEQWKQRKAERKERKASKAAVKESSKKEVAAGRRVSCPSIVMQAGPWSPRGLAAAERGRGSGAYDSRTLARGCCASRQLVHTLESGVFQLSQNFSQRREENGWRLDDAEAGEASYRSWR